MAAAGTTDDESRLPILWSLDARVAVPTSRSSKAAPTSPSPCCERTTAAHVPCVASCVCASASCVRVAPACASPCGHACEMRLPLPTRHASAAPFVSSDRALSVPRSAISMLHPGGNGGAGAPVSLANCCAPRALLAPVSMALRDTCARCVCAYGALQSDALSASVAICSATCSYGAALLACTAGSSAER